MQTQDRLEDLIGAIVPDPALHARWLNTFSYLEYVGFRKIVKSQLAEVLAAAILGHACEEGRHALGLKKLAIKLGGAQSTPTRPHSCSAARRPRPIFRTSTRLATRLSRAAPRPNAVNSPIAM